MSMKFLSPEWAETLTASINAGAEFKQAAGEQAAPTARPGTGPRSPPA